jgi:hypothetical protein
VIIIFSVDIRQLKQCCWKQHFNVPLTVLIVSIYGVQYSLYYVNIVRPEIKAPFGRPLRLRNVIELIHYEFERLRLDSRWKKSYVVLFSKIVLSLFTDIVDVKTKTKLNASYW